MKKIYMLNNSQGVIGLLLGLKSRITSTKPLLTMLALLMVCLFGVNEKAWGSEGKAYAWPNTSSTDKTNSLATGKINCGVYVSLNGNTPSGKGNYYQYDSSSGGLSKKTGYFKADANTGYVFLGWYSDASYNTFVSSSNPYTKEIAWNKELKLYAKFTWIYNVAFHGNNETDGTMNNQVFKHGINQTLSPNTFTRSYTVTYDENGGNTVDDAVATYSFAGWATSANGSVTYSDQQNITSDLTSTVNGTVDLYAKWSGGSVTLPTPTKNDGSQFEGWYVGSIAPANKITTATYTPTANVTLVANWVSKYDFEITGSNYTINNEAWTQTKAFNFVHADVNHMTTTIEHGDVISYNRIENKITALKIGTSKITFTQNTSSTVNNGSIVFTITVDSVANTLTVSGTSFTKYVDQEVTSVRSKQNSNGEITTTSSNPNLAHYDIANDKIVIPNSAAQKLPFEDVTITISQAATAKYKAKKHTITLKVQKYANTLYANSSASFAPTMYTDKTLDVTLTATNTDYAGSPISVEQVNAADTTIAKYEYSQASHSGTVTSRQFLASTSWHMTQPENYKYQAGSGNFTVSVAKASEATNCYIAEDNNEQQWGTIDKSRTLSFDIRGAKCSFQAKRSPITVVIDYTNNQDFYAEYSSDGSNWTQAQTIDLPNTNEWRDFSFNLPSDARYVRFESTTGATGYRHIRNVKIHRYTYLNVGTDNSSINGTLTINKKDGGSAIYPGEKGQQSTTVFWGIANGGNLKIKCDDPRFTFSQNTITGVDCNSGTTDITVYYKDSVAGTVTATATVYNDVYNRTFTVKGVIEKADQLITWNNDILRLGQSYNNVATANTLVTYESEDESIIRVDEDDKGHKTILTAVGTGTVNITATAEESSFYAEKSDTKSIKVTEKQIQWIDWNQSLFGLKLGGANVTMNAVAASDVEGCVSSRLIEYSSNNESVVKVVNINQLQIIGVGTAIITAVQAGGFDTDGHDYERAETEKTVIVRDPNAPCESFAYQQGQEVKMDCGWNALDKQTRTSEINFNGIIPATGTLRYKGEYRKVAINYFDGTMSVEQYIPGEDWKPVTGGDLGKPSIGTYKTANLTFDRRATKMRVKVTDGLGYHYFTDCQVTQARFIETTAPVDFNLNVGQQQNQVIYLSYSNITDGLSLTLAQGANSHFSVDKSFIEGSCGSAAKNVALTITYHPTAEETKAQDVLTITDGTTKCQVVLTGSATRVNRHINWDHADETDIYTVQTETLSAEARTDLNELAGTVAFSLAGSSTAAGSVSAENVLSFTSAGVADVVAYTKDDPRYNVAPNVVKTFNVAITPTTISTMPTLQSTVYGGTAVEDVMLTGGVAINTVNSGTVKGTFEVISPTTLNAGTYALTVRFTPEDENMYTGCTATLENVTIAQRTPEESELGVNVGTIIYGQRIDEASMTNSGTLAGTWYWKDEDANKEVKAVGTYDNLNVYFVPENTNYATVYSTVSVTVSKATPVVTAQASAITYGQPISASELSTASGEVSGTWAWSVDKTQVLSVGNHVLKANFTSANANYSDLSNVDVTLTVNKIEKLEVPVALSFCAGGEVTFHDNTYTEAGEYQIEAEGPTRDTIYNVTVTKLQPTTGTDSKTITVGASESWNGINLSGYAVGSHEVVFHTTNAAGCDSTVTLTLTVNAAVNTFIGNGGWENPNNWSEHVVPNGDAPTVIVCGALSIDENVTVGNLTIENTGSIAVITGGTLTVKGVSEYRAEYGDVHVLNDGALALINSANLQVRHFTLDAKLAGKNNANVKEAAASGQVENPNQLAINGDAYFQMAFDPKGKISFGWYDFVVPFPVNISNGIFREGDLVNHLVSGVDFIVQEHSESKCANNQKAWTNFYGTMEPGRVYTIGFNYDPNFDQNVFVFKKANGAIIGGPTEFATQYTEGSGTTDDYGWNGLGNGMLKHGYITGTFAHMQVYNHAENKYDMLTGKNPTFAIGTSFFVQVDNTTPTMEWHAANANEDHPLFAPKREAIDVEEFLLSLREENQVDASDHLYISASEEATEAYVIGRDLRKMGTPTEAKTAQMWTTKGGKNLCDIETRMVNYKASSDLYFFAPQATTFELTAEEMPENATLYLTKNGKAIWNLSMSPYELNLEQGTTEGYGLRIVASQQTTTDIENGGLLNDANGVRKVLIDNVIYIVTPEGEMYDLMGKSVNY